jgi:hypothetical protein
VGTVGTARGKSGSWVLRQYLLVLQGTVGTVGTAGGKSGSWVLQQYPWVLQGTVGTAGTVQFGYCGYCRNDLQGTAGYCRVLQNVHKLQGLSAARNIYTN